MTKITGFFPEQGGAVTYEGFTPPTQLEIKDYLKKEGILTDIKESIRKAAKFYSERNDLNFDTDEVNKFGRCVLKYMDEEGGYTGPEFNETIRDSEILQAFTAPPKDGDYDWHIVCAMRAMYMHMKKIMEG